MTYNEKILDHSENPRNMFSLNNDAKNVGTGMIQIPSNGDIIRLQIQVNGQGIIENAMFKTYGCSETIASSSLATELIKGKTLEEAKAIKNTDIVKELSLPLSKAYCSEMVVDAISAAVDAYKNKQDD